MCRLFVNLETREKTHVKGTGVMCPMDGYVVFRQSELLAGRLGKVTLGGGNKSGLFQATSWPFCPSHPPLSLPSRLPFSAATNIPDSARGRLSKVTLGGGNESGLFKVPSSPRPLLLGPHQGGGPLACI